MGYIKFRLNDPNKSYSNVNVAGNFNNWNSTLDKLNFNDSNKYWILNMLTDSPTNTKIIYKYVVDNNIWICDNENAVELDDKGNENNIIYAIEEEEEEEEEKKGDNNDINDITPVAQLTKPIDNQVNDKPLEEENLFEPHESQLSETAPTSGDEEIVPNTDILTTTNKHNDVQDIINNIHNNNNNNNQNTHGNNNPEHAIQSIWETVRWFFRYYILSWFLPDK